MLQTTEDGLVPPSAAAPHSIPIVALVGFMGAGKTTVGSALASRLGWNFCDLDQAIESREARTVAEIFAETGEGGFREIECQTLEQMLQTCATQPMVVGLGGGAYLQPGVRELLHARGAATVWLHAPVEELYRRCEAGAIRPLRRSIEEFCALYETRIETYRQAQFSVNTDGKETQAIVEDIVAALALNPKSRSME